MAAWLVVAVQRENDDEKMMARGRVSAEGRLLPSRRRGLSCEDDSGQGVGATGHGPGRCERICGVKGCTDLARCTKTLPP
jgi:hypothetical protein